MKAKDGQILFSVLRIYYIPNSFVYSLIPVWEIFFIHIVVKSKDKIIKKYTIGIF